MNSCDKVKDLLVLYAESELDTAQTREVSEHLTLCPGCRDEVAGIGLIRDWLTDSDVFAPKQDYVWELMPRTLAARAKAASAFRSWLPANLGTPGWVLSMAATVVLAFGLVWFTHRTPPATPVVAAAPAPGNDAFLGKIQSAYAREATARYLTECRDLLLNLMRAERSCEGHLYDVSLEVARARQLLQRKRMLDFELQSPEVARAKNLCDELENFLVHLSTSDKCERPDGLRRMERFIQREQLLLRINVLQSEFS